MPYAIEIDTVARLVTVKIYGRFTVEDLGSADDEMRAREDFDAEFYELVDMRAAETGELQPDDLREFVARPPAFSTESRRAFVMPNSFVALGLGRMFQLLREGKAGKIRVFTDLTDAERWLKMDSENR